MAELYVDRDLDAELEVLANLHPQLVGLVDAYLEKIGGDPVAIETFTRGTPKWEYLYDPSYEVKRFAACWQLQPRRHIYIVRLYDDDGSLADYRLLVGHDPSDDSLVALSFLHRGIAYDTGRPEFAALLARYDGWGLPHG